MTTCFFHGFFKLLIYKVTSKKERKAASELFKSLRLNMLHTDGCCCEAAAEMFRIVCPSVRRSEAESHRRHITVTSRRKETDSVRLITNILMILYDVGFYPLIYKGEVSGPRLFN